jgi:hypothetical protein
LFGFPWEKAGFFVAAAKAETSKPDMMDGVIFVIVFSLKIRICPKPDNPLQLHFKQPTFCGLFLFTVRQTSKHSAYLHPSRLSVARIC